MTLVAVGSWRGVGASTAAMLLAAAWSERSTAAGAGPTTLVEADPAGGVLAVRCPDLPGAVDRAADVAFGRRGDHTDGDGTTSLAAPPSPRLGDVDVMAVPGDPFAAWSTVSSTRFVDEVLRLGRVGSVVVDVGCVRDARSPARSIIGSADALVLVSTPDPAALVGTVDWCDSQGRTQPDADPVDAPVAMLVVDAPTTGRERFEHARVEIELGPRLVGWWPWEPDAVDRLLRGATTDHRSLRRSRLVAAAGASLARIEQVVSPS